MPAQPVKRRRIAMLEEMGEEKVFNLYLELGSVRKVAEELWEPHGGEKPAHRYLYDWLHLDDDRWERWQQMRRMRGHLEADDAYTTAMSATEEDVRSKKLKVDTLKWRASILNREEYGDRVHHEVSGTVGHAWLDAVDKATDEPGDEPEQIEEADVEILPAETDDDE